MEYTSRYIVGIDLGTTHCVVSYCDTATKKKSIHLFSLIQLDENLLWKPYPLLPSFLYLLDETDAASIPRPSWDTHQMVIGRYAKEEGVKTPTKCVHSAKSWLSYSAINRQDKILPLEAAHNERKISPLEASASLLNHIRRAWNTQLAKGDYSQELEEQQIILTVPASFDEVARSLTVKAAHQAGLSHLTLVEEPLAAFYAYLIHHEAGSEQVFKEDDTILVCDVGGGTTDFTLIDVVHHEERIGFSRQSVGDHLLLGGDNMDRAIAHFLEKKIQEEQKISLQPEQWSSLCYLARYAKESLLSSGKGKESLWIPGTGSQLIGKGIGIEITYDEVETLLIKGFFGKSSFEEARQIPKKTGVRSFGLPYENEPSIIKHLAAFLFKSGKKRKPTHLLFNGGTLKPSIFQRRIEDCLNEWFKDDYAVHLLEVESLDYAVSKGAVYFGKTKRGEGIQVFGGSPRSYYLKVGEGVEALALTLLERGAVEGSKYVSQQTFSLLPNTAITFQIYTSHTRLEDHRGDLVSFNEEQLQPLLPLHTILRFGSKRQERIPVKVGIHLTEIGILELWLESTTTSHVWSLEFSLRTEEKAASKKIQETLTQEELRQAQAFFLAHFTPASHKTIISLLEGHVNQPKNEWPVALLRAFFDVLLKMSSSKDKTPFYESRFWNLCGYFLRPGCGDALDELRVRELWKLILADSKKAKCDEVIIQKWICYRRLAAGLSKGQQTQLFNEIYPLLGEKGKKSDYYFSECIRVLGSLENVDVSYKIKLGKKLIEKVLKGQAKSYDYWAIGRLGARELFHGSIGQIINRNICEEWVQIILDKAPFENEVAFALSFMARKVPVRELNIQDALFEKVLDRLSQDLENLQWIEIATGKSSLTENEREQLFGDQLPAGLLLTNKD